MMRLISKTKPILFFIVVLFFMQIQSARAVIEVREVGLSQLSLDEVGTLTDRNGGLGADIWQNTPHHYVEKLLALLPDEVGSETLKDLKRRLLATAAVPPIGSSEKKADLFMLRLRQLAKMGEYEQTAAMAEIVPVELRTEEMVQVIIAARLLAKEEDLACKAIMANVATYESVEWRKWTAICQARSGNKAASNLTVKLLSESGFEPGERYQSLLGAVASKDIKTKQKAMADWADAVAALVLNLPDVEVYTPSQKFLDSDLMFNAQVAAWWKQQEVDEPKQRVEALVKLYGILVGLGDEIKADDWLDLALFAIKNVDEKGVHYQLGNAVESLAAQGRKGDVLMLTIKIAGKEPVSALPYNTLHSILKALKMLGYEKEANAIAREALQ